MAKPIETRFCEHCNEPVTRGHRACEHCGTRLKSSRRTAAVMIVIAVIVAVFAVVSISKYMSNDRFESTQQTGAKSAADTGNQQN